MRKKTSSLRGAGIYKILTLHSGEYKGFERRDVKRKIGK
jgi:hypothetical protein